jgi:DNA-directed RNA polymerase beta subunit
MGRLCMSETPEGTNIGLRKNIAMLTRVTGDVEKQALVNSLKGMGLEMVSTK